MAIDESKRLGARDSGVSSLASMAFDLGIYLEKVVPSPASNAAGDAMLRIVHVAHMVDVVSYLALPKMIAELDREIAELSVDLKNIARDEARRLNAFIADVEEEADEEARLGESKRLSTIAKRDAEAKRRLANDPINAAAASAAPTKRYRIVMANAERDHLRREIDVQGAIVDAVSSALRAFGR